MRPTNPSEIRVVNSPLQEAVAAPTLRQTTRNLKREVLSEDLTYGAAPLKVDRDRHIIYNVKILGWRSKNKNRRYSPNGVDPQLYEGAVVNIDHPDGEAAKGPRPLSARFGEVVGIYKNGDGLFAKELHYIPTHPLAESILYMAESKPHLFGCSQNAFGDVYEDATGEIVETVTDVRSIDLVSEPATTKGLYEAVGDPPGADDDLAPAPGPDDLPAPGGDSPPEDEIPLGGPAAGPAPDAMPPATEPAPGAAPPVEDSPQDPSGGTGEEFDISNETISMLEKIFNSNMPIQEKKRRLGHLLAIAQKHQQMQYEAVMTTKLKTVDDAKKFLLESKDPVVARAGRAVVGTLDKYEVQAAMTTKRTLAEGLCHRAKLPKEAVTPHFLKLLVECDTEKDMMEAIEDRRQLAGIASGRKPRSADPLAAAALTEATKDTSGMSEADKAAHQKKLDAAFLADVFKG